jgi:hypothetical protein
LYCNLCTGAKVKADAGAAVTDGIKPMPDQTLPLNSQGGGETDGGDQYERRSMPVSLRRGGANYVSTGAGANPLSANVDLWHQNVLML